MHLFLYFQEQSFLYFLGPLVVFAYSLFLSNKNLAYHVQSYFSFGMLRCAVVGYGCEACLHMTCCCLRLCVRVGGKEAARIWLRVHGSSSRRQVGLGLRVRY